jgi:hypothetical protein
MPIPFVGREQTGTLKAQDAARASANAFTASQAVFVLNRLAGPCVPPHINANRAVVGADTALNAAGRVGYNPSCNQRFTASRFFSKKTFKHETSIVIFLAIRVAA